MVSHGRIVPGFQDPSAPDRLDEVFDLAPSFLAVVRGPQHVFVRANRAYRRLVGDRELIGRSVREALPELEGQGFFELLDEVYRAGEPFTATEAPIRFRQAGGAMETRHISFVYQASRGEDGRIDGIIAHGIDVTEHVRARQILVEREAHYRSLIENSQDKIGVLAIDGRILYESPSLERLLGWHPDEVVGRSAFDFIHPEDAEAVRGAIESAAADPGAAERVECRLLHKDGSYCIFEMVGQARATAAGLEIVTNGRDITRRRADAEQLREREERLRVLVEQIPQLVWSTTADGYHDYFNKKWYDYTGMAPGGGQGWNWKDYLHPDDYDRTLEVWNRSLASGEPYELEYRFRRASDGSYRWFIGRALPMRGANGEVIRWFGTCTDVHDERMALEAAQELQERYRAVAEATSDVVWDWDMVADTLWWNDKLERVFRLGPESLAGSIDLWTARIHEEDRSRVAKRLDGAIRDGRESWSDEYRFVRGDGSIAHVLDRGRIIRESNGRPVRMIGSMIDLTERNRLEGELRQAQKMEAVGKLAGGIAHDFNNLLTVIASYADLMLHDLPAPNPVRDDVEEIRKAASRASSLTRQLLAFGRRQVLQPRDVDLNEIVADLEKMLRRTIGEDVDLVANPGRDLPRVFADPGQIEQVLMNLVLNARDAMPKGGRLTIETRSRRRAGVDEVVLVVSDTGVGMDAETQRRIFEPFFTTKAGLGSGLGLATVHGIVSQTGGRISVDSTPGGGATFYVTLPVAVGESVAETPPAAAPAAREGTGTVLLVEDEDAVRAIARRGLERFGYSVIEASNGQGALDILADPSVEVDVLLTDLLMPVMGGRELAQNLGGRIPQSRIVFMSGYAEEDMFPEEVLTEESGFLEKPFTVDQLVEAVRARV